MGWCIAGFLCHLGLRFLHGKLDKIGMRNITRFRDVLDFLMWDLSFMIFNKGEGNGQRTESITANRASCY